MVYDTRRIDPHFGAELLWIDRERIAQTGDGELAVARSRLGDHDAGLAPAAAAT